MTLITKLEAATGADRELDIEILRLVKPEHYFYSVEEERRLRSKCAAINMLKESAESCHRSAFSSTPQYTSSIDAALSLGRNAREQREILGAIYENWNELYDLKRCIIFGCVLALKARMVGT